MIVRIYVHLNDGRSMLFLLHRKTSFLSSATTCCPNFDIGIFVASHIGGTVATVSNETCRSSNVNRLNFKAKKGNTLIYDRKDYDGDRKVRACS